MIILNNQAEVSDVRFGNKAEFCFTNSLVVPYKNLNLQFPDFTNFMPHTDWKLDCIFHVVFKDSIIQFWGNCMI